MGKYSAQAAFDQLAVELKEKVAEALVVSPLPEDEKRQTMLDVVHLIQRWRREHDYALDVYYGVDRTKHMKGALRNDLTKGRLEG